MVDAASSSPRLNVEVVSHDRYRWIYVERPSPAEVEHVARLLGLDVARVEDCVGRQPKLTVGSGVLCLVLPAPIPNRLARTVSSTPVSFLAGPGYLLTLHGGEVRWLARAFRECLGDEAARERLLDRGPAHLLGVLLDQLLTAYAESAEELRAELEALEDALVVEEQWRVGHDLGLLRRETAALRRLMRTTRRLIDALPAPATRALSPSLDAIAQWSNLGDRAAYVWEVLEASRELADDLTAIHEAQVERRVATGVTLLAVLGASTMPVFLLLALASTSLRDPPLADDPSAFAYVLLAAAVAALVVLSLFKRRRWL